MAKFYKSVESRRAVFIEKAKKKYGNRYNYNEVIYSRNDCKVEIKCKVSTHGSFWVTPSNHLIKTGCQKCFRKRQKRIIANKKKETLKSRTDVFLKKAKALFGNKYTFDAMSYVNNTTPIKIKCNVHGYFIMSPGAFLRRGCVKCSRYDLTNKRKNSFNESCETRRNIFIKEANNIHNNLYDYSKMSYVATSGNKNTIEVICQKHGSFFPTPHNHLNGTGCPKCVGVYSIEARLALAAIIEYLDISNINYFFEDSEYHIGRFKYDLIIPSYYTCIEYNGSAWHPDYNALTASDWRGWTVGYRGIVTADEKMRRDIDKAKRLFDHNKCRTWMVTPSNAELYVQMILEEIKKAP